MAGMETFVENVLLEMIQEIERKDMPQVKGKDIPEVLQIFDECGIGYNKGLVECGKLRPTQEDYKPEKLESMKDSMKKGTWEASPIFISEEGHVIDGHHRWLAYKEVYGEDFKIPVIKMDLPQDKALYVFSVGADKVKEEINEAPRQGKTIAIYPGRFQPFHKNHYEAYQHLVKKFGKKNVYVATSNKVDSKKSPLNFREKKQIITSMFDIPAKNIIEVSNPYLHTTYKNIADMEKDVLVVAIGEKDDDRLVTGKYYERWKEGDKQPFGKKGYAYVVPLKTFKVNGKLVSGTSVREIFRTGSDKAKQQLFKKLYGKFDQKIYDLIVKKLNESMILSSDVIEEYIVQNDIKKIISELTVAADGQVDDGPATFYKTPDAYKKGRLNVKQKSMEEVIEQLGWQVLDWIAGDRDEYATQNYRYGIVGDVSFGDVGNRDSDYKDPVGQYMTYMKKTANLVGYSVVDWLLGDTKKDSIIDDPKKEMALQEPLTQDTSDAAEPIGERLFSKDWWTKNFLTESRLLNEGGAYGHMSHPFEDWNLTFGDIRKLIEAGLQGKLEMAQEKTDGQNLMVSWKDGQLVSARTKTQLKNAGEGALNRDQISQIFAGRGDIHDAFVFAMEDLEEAIGKLNEKDKEDIFANGRKFMNLEII